MDGRPIVEPLQMTTTKTVLLLISLPFLSGGAKLLQNRYNVNLFVKIQEVMSELKWTAGPLTVSFFHDVPGATTATRHIAALEAFSDPGVHSHIIPLFSGALLNPEFYVQLKVGTQ